MSNLLDVGKTQIISRFVDNKFAEQYGVTIGTAFRNNKILVLPNVFKCINCEIWDTVFFTRVEQNNINH